MRFGWVLILLAFVLGGCHSAPVGATPTATLPTLVLYRTRTPSPSERIKDVATPTPLPSATLTPRTYTVRLKDTYGTIAARFGVTVNDLISANPGVDPNALIVGMVLVIPPGSFAAGQGEPTSTAVAILVQTPNCQWTAEGGAWCFTEVENPQPFAVESVLVEFRLSSDALVLDSRVAPAPLNLIPSGAKIPVAVYFPPKAPKSALAGATIKAALPLERPSERYLPVELADLRTEIAGNRLSAIVRGAVINRDDERDARLVWVLAAARNSANKVIGIRRWEWQGESAPGNALPFSFVVYSQLEEIASVDVYVESRP